jgi:methylthioribose-1-phosphate isomerase
MVLQAIRYERGKLEILDQLKLPYEEVFVDITGPEDAWTAIRKMQVRGAPAIAIVAALSLAVWGAQYLQNAANKGSLGSQIVVAKMLSQYLAYLVTSRPTAVNLADAASKLDAVIAAAVAEPGATGSEIIEAYIEAAEQMLIDDVRDNENIGRFGAEWLLANTEAAKMGQKVSILTHCNTG